MRKQGRARKDCGSKVVEFIFAPRAHAFFGRVAEWIGPCAVFFLLILLSYFSWPLKRLNHQRFVVVVDKAAMHILCVVQHLEFAAAVKANGQNMACGRIRMHLKNE